MAPECPSVRELHVELDDVSQLLEISKEQFDEILSIVQHHTDETVSWLSNMSAVYSWVAQAVSNSSASQNIFHITKVRRDGGRGGKAMMKYEIKTADVFLKRNLNGGISTELLSWNS